MSTPPSFSLFFFNDTATTEIYTLSLHDALPIWIGAYDCRRHRRRATRASVRTQRFRLVHALRQDVRARESRGRRRTARLLLYRRRRRRTRRRLPGPAPQHGNRLALADAGRCEPQPQFRKRAPPVLHPRRLLAPRLRERGAVPLHRCRGPRGDRRTVVSG